MSVAELHRGMTPSPRRRLHSGIHPRAIAVHVSRAYMYRFSYFQLRLKLDEELDLEGDYGWRQRRDTT